MRTAGSPSAAGGDSVEAGLRRPVRGAGPRAGSARRPRANPPPTPMGVPSARQQAAPSMSPFGWKRMRPCPRPRSARAAWRGRVPQRVGHGVGEARLQFQAEALRPHPRALPPLPAGHAVVDQVEHRLQRRREDAQAPRQAQRKTRLAVLQHDQRRHRRRDPLARRQRVGQPRPRVEDVKVVVRDQRPCPAPCSARRTAS
jgi:hypothetical protein